MKCCVLKGGYGTEAGVTCCTLRARQTLYERNTIAHVRTPAMKHPMAIPATAGVSRGPSHELGSSALRIRFRRVRSLAVIGFDIDGSESTSKGFTQMMWSDGKRV